MAGVSRFLHVLFFVNQRPQTGNLAPDQPHLERIIQLACRLYLPQVKRFFDPVLELLVQFILRKFSKFLGFTHDIRFLTG